MKFIHISDVHLGMNPDKGKPWEEERIKEIEETFDKVIELCKDEEVRLLLISGNLYDAPPTEEDLKALDEKLSALSGTRTIMIAGSSDYMAPGSPAESYKFNSKTVILPADRTTNAYLNGINTCITGVSYSKPIYEDSLIDGINPGRAGAVNILIANGGTKMHMPFDKKYVAKKGFDYVALGGETRPQHILKNRMAYPGSPEPLGPKETGKRGYIEGEIDENGKVTINWKPIAKRNYINITVDVNQEFTEAELTEGLFAKLRKLGYENIYTITLKGHINRDMKFNFKKIKDRFYINDIIDRTLSSRDEENIYIENENNLIGRFIKNVRESYDIDEEIRKKAVTYGIEALISSGE